MSSCDDCGTRMSDGMCPNCHEELFILTTQSDCIDNVSQEFIDLAQQQKEAVKAKQGGGSHRIPVKDRH